MQNPYGRYGLKNKLKQIREGSMSMPHHFCTDSIRHY